MVVKRKKVHIIAGIVIVLIVMAVIAGVVLFDIDSFKPRIETAASEVIHLDVRINGEMGFSFFPFGLSADDIHVSNKGVEILCLQKMKIGLEVVSLLKQQIKVTSCELGKPTITIVKDAGGKYNFENPEKKSKQDGVEAIFSLKKLRLFQGVIIYFDKKTGEKTELKGINLEIQDLLVGDTTEDMIKNVSFTGNIDCKTVRKKDLKIDNIKSLVKAEKGVIRFIPLTMDIFDAKGEGAVTVDKSKDEMVYRINLKILKVNFAKLEESFGMEKMIGGKIDLHAFLTIQKKGSLNRTDRLDGTFSLQGDNLVIYTMDLDEALSLYETSQEFNLVDLGAFFIAGPFGTIGVKGYRYWNGDYQIQGGQSVITQFISSWKIKDGIADAVDCALATPHNRIALKGGLNFVSERYDNVTVALLDSKGCAKFQQSISGSLNSPEIGAVGVVESLGEPVFNFYRKTKRFFQSGSCEVFYRGSIRQP